jgi:hypothetical protein
MPAACRQAGQIAVHSNGVENTIVKIKQYSNHGTLPFSVNRYPQKNRTTDDGLRTTENGLQIIPLSVLDQQPLFSLPLLPVQDGQSSQPWLHLPAERFLCWL